MEMVAAIVHQLTRNLSDEDVRNSPAFGFPWTAGSIQSTGDPIADLTEDLAADGAMT